MTYARGRICWDADSHLMPKPDFLSKHADPAIRDALKIGGGNNGGERFQKWFGKIVESVEERISDPNKTAELEENVIASAKGWAAHGAVVAEERSRTLDLLGFRGQLVFSTFAGHYLASRDPDLVYGGTRAHTRAMADFCANDERLMAADSGGRMRESNSGGTRESRDEQLGRPASLKPIAAALCSAFDSAL